MAWDLATAKTKHPTASDADLSMAMDLTVAFLNDYFDREFIYGERTETFIPRNFPEALFTLAYPIDRARPVTVKIDGGATQNWQGSIDYKFGELEANAGFRGKNLEITYTAGFNPIPADLEVVMYSVLDQAVAMIVGTGSAAAASSGAIESITVPDVGTIRFAKDASATASSSPNNDADGPLSSYAYILNKYRRILC